MKVKNAELSALQYCLANLKNTGLSGASGWKIVSLQEEVESALETYKKAHEAIIKEFVKEGEEGIESTDERYPLVTAKLNSMNAESVEVKNYGFLSQDELMSSAEGLSFEAIRLIKKYLAKSDDSVD